MSKTTETPATTETIVRAVLFVARLGEADRRGWWGTRSFGAAGRVVLGQRLPRTWRMAAAELDITSAQNRHDEVLDRRNAVHLFSDNWPIRRWTSAWVSEQKTENPPDHFFEVLESISADEIADRLRSNRASTEVSGTAVRVGSISQATLDSPEELTSSALLLAAAYADMASFTVPYLELAG